VSKEKSVSKEPIVSTVFFSLSEALEEICQNPTLDPEIRVELLDLLKKVCP